MRITFKPPQKRAYLHVHITSAGNHTFHLVEVPIRYQAHRYGSSNIAHVKEDVVLLRMCAYASRKLEFI